jgi:hypothetical protein
MWSRSVRRPPAPRGSAAPELFAAKPEWSDHGPHATQTADPDSCVLVACSYEGNGWRILPWPLRNQWILRSS